MRYSVTERLATLHLGKAAHQLRLVIAGAAALYLLSEFYRGALLDDELLDGDLI